MKRGGVASMGVLLALAMVLSYAESLVPVQFFLPGIKLGLANLVIFIALYELDAPRALLISLMRLLLVAFTFGSLFSMLYGLAGALLSFAVMVLLKKTDKFAPVTVSAVGGASHNVGQIIAAVLITKSGGLAVYLPVLLVGGVVSGICIGLLGEVLRKRVIAK